MNRAFRGLGKPALDRVVGGLWGHGRCKSPRPPLSLPAVVTGNGWGGWSGGPWGQGCLGGAATKATIILASPGECTCGGGFACVSLSLCVCPCVCLRAWTWMCTYVSPWGHPWDWGSLRGDQGPHLG